MILSNTAIAKGCADGKFQIQGLANSTDTSKAPFNTSAVDLRLSTELLIAPKGKSAIVIDLSSGASISPVLNSNFQKITISKEQGYILKPNTFILGNTIERVDFPLCETIDCITYAARVEGKSSLARCGLLVHFTAPTIHAGFSGNITLEIINLGPFDILLTPNMYICQLIIEEVIGQATTAPNQFSGQTAPAGVIK